MDIDGLPPIDPSPDEEAWEAYVSFALDELGVDLGPGLTNAALGRLEELIGWALPFEVGLLLVMGQPDTPPWVQWDTDPAGVWAAWNARLLDDLVDAVDAGTWHSSWGRRPDDDTDRRGIVEAQLGSSPLLPVWGSCAVPLVPATGRERNDGNPVLSVEGSSVSVVGVDLAAWFHAQFRVPLPLWEVDGDRTIPFWSDLTRPRI